MILRGLRFVVLVGLACMTVSLVVRPDPSTLVYFTALAVAAVLFGG